jgi:hypothetical protein
MISLIFETKRFRVQITGKTAWVETSKGAGWVFRDQHSLPLSPDSLYGRGLASVLRAAVQHFEHSRHGDQSLREALTGVPEVQAAKMTTPVVPIPSASGLAVKPMRKSALPNNASPKPKDFRVPIKPPLVNKGRYVTCWSNGEYSLNQETHCIGADRTMVMIPLGSSFSLIGPVADEPEFVEILWEEQTLRMFASDFAARTEQAPTQQQRTIAASADSDGEPRPD